MTRARVGRAPEWGVRALRPHRILLAACILPALASDPAIGAERTPWEKCGPIRVELPAEAERHGAPETYRHAPPVPDPGPAWKELTGFYPAAENPVDIHYLGPNGDYGSALRTCLTEAEFTYFQTFITLAANETLEEGEIRFGPVDDGARIMIFNSRYPVGFTPEDGYAEIGQTGGCDLREYLAPGETNRIVVQHLDDCAGQAWLHAVLLNVSGASAGRNNTWGSLKERYR